MSEDREILREVWNGKVPVCISLSNEDCSTLSAPDPHYIMVPRMTYFPLVMEKIRKHFIRSVEEKLHSNQMWLDYDAIPLKWHYPVGVLFDLHTHGDALPWTLTAHFSNFPEDDLISCQNREIVESHFLSSIKEADGFKHRGQVITNMQRQEHKHLWNGLCNDRFDQFWVVNRKLMEVQDGEDGFKHIPFRLYGKTFTPIQKLIRPINEDGGLVMLGDLKDIFFKDEDEDASLVIQGISTPMETPLQWLSEHLSHPDNFLHICLRRPRKEDNS